MIPAPTVKAADQRLILYSPVPGSGAAERLRELIEGEAELERAELVLS